MDIGGVISVVAGAITILTGTFSIAAIFVRRRRNNQTSDLNQFPPSPPYNAQGASTPSRGRLATLFRGLIKWILVVPFGVAIGLFIPVLSCAVGAVIGVGIGIGVDALRSEKTIVALVSSSSPTNGEIIGLAVGAFTGLIIGIRPASKIIARALQFH